MYPQIQLAFAWLFLWDLRSRLAGPCLISTDKLDHYIDLVPSLFGPEFHHATIEKGTPVPGIHNAYVERQHLTLRMAVKRYTRQSNAHSKTYPRHCRALALYLVHYNWIRPHMSLSENQPVTPAMAQGLVTQPRTLAWLLRLSDNRVRPKKQLFV